MYEVWNERLVTQDGIVQRQPEVEGHVARVWGDGDVELRLGAAEILLLRAGEGQRVSVKASELRNALDDLERLSPYYERSSVDGEIAERAAAAIERACEQLDDGLATELRSATLQLIERATRPVGSATVQNEG